MTEHNLPVPDDNPKVEYTDEEIQEWTREDLLDAPLLSAEEIEQLRNHKKTLTEYAQKKLRKLMKHD